MDQKAQQDLFLVPPSAAEGSFVDHPLDVLNRILGFLDADTLIQVTRVNRFCYRLAMPFLPHCLFQYHNTQTPHALNDGRLLNALREAVALSVPDTAYNTMDAFFSETQQTLIFQKFMRDVFEEELDPAYAPELLIDFLTRMSRKFREAGERNRYDQWDNEARLIYVEKALASAPSHIAFLFDRTHIKRFFQLYDRKEKRFEVKTDADYLFLARCLQAAVRLEGFLTTLMLSEKLEKDSFISKEIITAKKWSALLLGDGIVALNTQFSISLSLLSDIFKSLTPVEIEQYEKAMRSSSEISYQPHPPPLTLEQAQFLWRKLRPIDILNWIKLTCSKSRFYHIERFLFTRSPYFLPFITTGSLIGDTALIYCFKEAGQPPSGFFYQLVEIPDVTLRLQTPLFLHRLFASSLFSDQEKSGLVSQILQQSNIVGALPESTIFFLLRYLPLQFDRFLYVDNLFVANKLTRTLLLKLVEPGLPGDPRQYALSILEAKSARILLAQDTVCAMKIAEVAIKSTRKERIIYELGRWFEDEKGEIHQDSHRAFSFHGSVLLKVFADEDLVSVPQFFRRETFLAFLDRIFSIGRMTSSLLSLLMKTFPDKARLGKDIFIFYALSIVERSDRRQWLSQTENRDVARLFTQCVLASDREVNEFLQALSPVIQQFSALQCIELWCRAQPQHRPAVENFIPLNHWAMIGMRLNRTPALCEPIFIENQSLLERQLIDRLTTPERSAQSFIDCLFQQDTMQQIQPWCRAYPRFLARLQKPDIYRYVWEQCLSLLTHPYVDGLPQPVLDMLALLIFLPVPHPTEFNKRQQKACIRVHNPLQIYTVCVTAHSLRESVVARSEATKQSRKMPGLPRLANNASLATTAKMIGGEQLPVCLQLAQKSGALSSALQQLFYPVCLPFLGISELQQLKQALSVHGLNPLFFPGHDIEAVLAKKVRQGGADNHQALWRDALTTPELGAGLLCLLIGASCLMAGLIIGGMILTGLGAIAMLLGAGIVGVPVGLTLWHRQIQRRESSDPTIEVEGSPWPMPSEDTVVSTLPPSLTIHHHSPIKTSKPSLEQSMGENPIALKITEFNLGD